MNATLTQDIIHIITEFKKRVNPEFIATPNDIEKIKRLIAINSIGRSNEGLGDVMYTCVDYDGLKRNDVKNFDFSISSYEMWVVETIKLLKAKHKTRRENYARIK